MDVDTEKVQKLIDFMDKQNSLLDRIIGSLDNIDRRVTKIEEKID